jgi:hypothetical protein
VHEAGIGTRLPGGNVRVDVVISRDPCSVGEQKAAILRSADPFIRSFHWETLGELHGSRPSSNAGLPKPVAFCDGVLTLIQLSGLLR